MWVVGSVAHEAGPEEPGKGDPWPSARAGTLKALWPYPSREGAQSMQVMSYLARALQTQIACHGAWP